MEDPTPDPVDSHRPSEDLPVLYSPLISEEPDYYRLNTHLTWEY